MFKRVLAVGGSILFIISLGINYNVNELTKTSALATWNESYDNIQELTNNADVIVKGRVLSSEPQIREDMVFTMNHLEVQEIMQGTTLNNASIIDILQTGGSMDGIITEPIKEAPLLKPDQDYILYLKLTEYDEVYGQYYLIEGGYQGIAYIDEKEIIPVSSENSIFEEYNNLDQLNSVMESEQN